MQTWSGEIIATITTITFQRSCNIGGDWQDWQDMTCRVWFLGGTDTYKKVNFYIVMGAWAGGGAMFLNVLRIFISSFA